MSYTIRREFSPDRMAIVFECDPQSEEELLRDFPMLRHMLLGLVDKATTI